VFDLLWRLYILSNPDNLDRDSPYLAARNSRFKINNCIGFGQTEKKYDWCPNGCSKRLFLQKDGSLICTKCGKTITEDQQQREQQHAKLSLKHDDRPGAPIVISQQRRKRKATGLAGNEGSLTEEDINDLKEFGIQASDLRDYIG
jgi:uncharacterized Zn finger protein (UPF0148 family)